MNAIRMHPASAVILIVAAPVVILATCIALRIVPLIVEQVAYSVVRSVLGA